MTINNKILLMENTEANVNVYILKLEQNKYFINSSIRKTMKGVQSDIDKHFKGKGVCWIKKYKPLEMIKIMPNKNRMDETKETIKYMEIYGLDNVRGGEYKKVNLSAKEKKTINEKINIEKQRKNNEESEYEEVIVWECDICNKEHDTEDEVDICEKTHEHRRILSNLLKRFPDTSWITIENLCEKYNYHGGKVARELRQINEFQFPRLNIFRHKSIM